MWVVQCAGVAGLYSQILGTLGRLKKVFCFCLLHCSDDNYLDSWQKWELAPLVWGKLKGGFGFCFLLFILFYF